MSKQNPFNKEQQQVSEEEKKALDLQRTNEIADVRAVLSTDAGRRFYWRVMERCKPFQNAKHHSGSETYFNLGEQAIGHWLWNELMDSAPEVYLQMIAPKKEG